MTSPITCVCNVCGKQKGVKSSLKSRLEIPKGWIEITTSDLTKYHLCSKNCISLFLINHERIMPGIKKIKDDIRHRVMGILGLAVEETEKRLKII